MILVSLAAATVLASFGDRQGVAHTLHERVIYWCGWDNSHLSPILFGVNAVPFDGQGAHSNDIMIFGMYGPCTPTDAFRGKILYLNGEDNCQGSYKYVIGPPSNCGTYTLDVTYTAIFEPLLRPYTRMRVTAYPAHRSFLAYVFQKCVGYREKLFDAVVQDDRLPQPTAGGPCHGSYPQTSGRELFGPKAHKNAKPYAHFRFVIAAEHGNSPGFVTEKILETLVAGAIPVYTGSTAVFSIFNAAAFIYYPESNPRAALDRIDALEQDHAAYLKMANEPMFAPGAQQYLFPGLVPKIHALLAK